MVSAGSESDTERYALYLRIIRSLKLCIRASPIFNPLLFSIHFLINRHQNWSKSLIKSKWSTQGKESCIWQCALPKTARKSAGHMLNKLVKMMPWCGRPSYGSPTSNLYIIILLFARRDWNWHRHYWFILNYPVNMMTYNDVTDMLWSSIE